NWRRHGAEFQGRGLLHASFRHAQETLTPVVTPPVRSAGEGEPSLSPSCRARPCARNRAVRQSGGPFQLDDSVSQVPLGPTAPARRRRSGKRRGGGALSRLRHAGRPPRPPFSCWLSPREGRNRPPNRGPSAPAPPRCRRPASLPCE